MMLTAILCTARPSPMFEWMAESIVLNLEAYPVPFELIVVDKLLWDTEALSQRHYRESFKELKSSFYDLLGNDASQDRREALDVAIQGRFSYRHVPPKPTVWQGPWRKTQRDYFDLSNARNTGIALARGEHLIFFDDCTVLGSRWLEGHVLGASRQVAVCGAFRSYNTATVADGRVIDGELHPNGIDPRGEVMKAAAGAHLWGLNMSFPLRWVLTINGYDEKYSGQGGSEDCDFGVRLERAGCRLVYIPWCHINQILETHEPVCEFAAWGKPQPKPQKEIVLKDGRGHFANEKLIQDLHEDPARVSPTGNDFNLRELRRKALQLGYKGFPVERDGDVDWRDGQRLEEMD